ncbi:hypothetical protein HG15A2_46420 [Adhaeretor mobilis]|uniref:Uncharacterized protein n=1 Tax=Adhaeretor mobilis TaxID=1930276 RepID=A0A517N2B7_9BACT|nr:hypothetical protein HG15A2_46420 [Adhaeretor mobilis]
MGLDTRAELKRKPAAMLRKRNSAAAKLIEAVQFNAGA